MPKKPTEPYGYIAFGKSGAVESNIETLPNDKEGQELEIGQKFAHGLEDISGEIFKVSPLGENDHDFTLTNKNRIISVQATEIVSRGYLHKIDLKEYISGALPFTSTVHLASNEIYGVDEQAKEMSLLRCIEGKIARKYAKPKHEFWLLVWTVSSDYFIEWNHNGEHHTSNCAIRARDYLQKNGSGAFDEIWFFKPNLRPFKIWPA